MKQIKLETFEATEIKTDDENYYVLLFFDNKFSKSKVGYYYEGFWYFTNCEIAENVTHFAYLP